MFIKIAVFECLFKEIKGNILAWFMLAKTFIFFSRYFNKNTLGIKDESYRVMMLDLLRFYNIFNRNKIFLKTKT